MWKRYLHIIFLLFIIFFINTKNEVTAKPFSIKERTIVLPPSFQHQLDSLKEKDNLNAWLNTWYVYLADDPDAHYKELNIPLQTIWRKPKTDAEQVAWFYLLIFTGYYELQQGNIVQSIKIYEQAYQFVQNKKAISNKEILEYLIKPLGNNYTRLGDYERALYIQKEGLKLAEATEDAMQEAAILANMSTTARWNDHLQEALQYSKKALQKVKTGTALQGLILSTRADILQDNGEISDAESAIRKAVDIFSHLSIKTNQNNAYWYAGALVTAGDIARKKQQENKAVHYYFKALHIFKTYFPKSKYREKIKIQIALGQINLAQKNYQNSLQYYNKALAGLLPHFNKKNIWPKDNMLYPENTLLDGLAGKAELLHRMGEDRMALTGYQKAAIVLQKLRKTIFSREARRLLQQQSLQTTEKAIELAFRLYKKTENNHYAEVALQLAEQHKARLLLDDLQKNIIYSQANQKDSILEKQQQLNRVIAFYTHSYIDAILNKNTSDSVLWKQKIDQAQFKLSLLSRQVKEKYPVLKLDSAINIKQLYKSLPDKTIAWEYFTGPSKWYGFSLDKNGIRQFNYIGEADTLSSGTMYFIHHWFSEGPNAMINQPQSYYEQSFSLYKKLSLSVPKGYKNLLLIPDGILGNLPFEALITDSVFQFNPAHWPYLLQKAATSQSYSLSVWHQLQKEFKKINNTNGFSGFFINPEGGNNLAALSGVREEEKGIKKLINGNFYINKKATAGQLLKAIQKNEVVHISTHAFLLSDQQIPALQMADKRIVLADLYPLHAHPALVVISACQTADGLLSPGEGIISLAREFTAIGSGGVIAALWSINDKTAAQLTTVFYKNLKESRDKSGALYLAKKEWLEDNQRNSILKLPYYWAGLVYYGNNILLSKPLHSTFHLPFWGWGIAIFAILTIVVLMWKRKKRLIINRIISLFQSFT